MNFQYPCTTLIDFGELKQQSNVRPNRIFTASKKVIQYKVG